MTLILFLVGFVILIKGADILIGGASSVAKIFGVSPWVIGLTIVGIGTSIPELAISLFANVIQKSDISLGTIFGSNTFNLLFVTGIAAVLGPLTMRRKWVLIDLAVNAASVLIAFFIAQNGITRGEGLLLTLLFVAWLYFVSRNENEVVNNQKKTKFLTMPVAAMFILAGVIGIYLGGKWVVDGVIAFARFAGVGEALISLTAVAIGTSIPELVVSARAAMKGDAAIAVGNIIGSNVFDFLGIIGIAALVRPFSASGLPMIDILITFSATIFLIIFALVGTRYAISRKQGILLVFLYLIYFIYLVVRG